MIKLKDLLLENPDGFEYDGYVLEWYEDGVYTFLIYRDIVDNADYWVAWDVKKQILLCENRSIEKLVQPRGFNDDEIEEAWSYVVEEPTHNNLKKFLYVLRRISNNRDLNKCYGRVFDVDDKFIMSFWDEDAEVIKHRSKLDDFFSRVGINLDKLLIEPFESPQYFVSYRKFFGVKKPKAASVLAKQRMQMARDLHMKKAQLDKEILNALQKKPKSFNDLYVSLEKQLGMPIARIRREFRGIPLDNLIVRKIKSLSSAI